MSRLLSDKLRQVKRRHAGVALARGVFGAVGLAVLALAGEMIADWQLELPAAVRGVWLTLGGGVLAFVLTKYAVLPVLWGLDDETVALWVERMEPEFRSRLIASVQLSRAGAVPAGASAALVGAMVRQTEEFAEPIDFARVVPAEPVVRLAVSSGAVVLAALAALAFGGEATGALLKRALLVPGVEPPRKTRVECLSGDLVVARGDTVTLEARALGVVPKVGRVQVRYDAAEVGQTLAMEAKADAAGQFVRTIGNVQESFTYRVLLNDGRSQEHRVEVVLRPAVSLIECRQEYPAYTKLGIVKRSVGDLSMLAGSRLLLNVTANKPVKIASPGDAVRNYVHLAGGERDYPLTTVIDDARRLVARDDAGQEGIPLPPGTSGFSVHLVDEHGLTSRNEATYRIDLMPDQSPTIRVTHPERREELVTPAAKIVVGFDAADDFAIGGVWLKYKVSRAAPPDANAAELRPRGKNVAEGKAVSQSSTEHGGEAKRAVDGNTDGNYAANSVTHTRGEQSPWWQVDLGSVQEIEAVQLWNRTDGASERLANVYLFVAEQPFDGKNLDALRGGEPVWSYFHPGQAGERLTVPVQRRGRYVRVQLQDPQILSLAEVKVFASAGGSDAPVQSIALETGGTPKSLRGYHEWDLAKLRPAEGSLVEWWLEVEDTNNVTGPGRGASEHYQVRVVSEREKRAELFMRLGDVWAPINDMTESQQDLNRTLGKMVVEKAVGGDGGEAGKERKP